MNKEQIIQILTPALNTRMLTAEQKEAFEQGLTLLESVPSAQALVSESHLFRAYLRRELQ